MAGESKKQCTCLGEKTHIKYITFTVPIEKEVPIIDKMEKKLQKMYLAYYNLFIVQDLWQVHYQTLSIIFLREFIELIVILGTMIKKCQTCRIKYKYCDWFLEYATLKMI